MATKITIEQGDITGIPSDLLLLKHAKGFHGADLVVADRLLSARVCTETQISPALHQSAIVDSRKAVAAARVMFVGTAGLGDFSYPQMRHFASRAIEILAAQGHSLKLLTTTVHGVNYGLDATEALQSLVQGFREGLARHPELSLGEIRFVEKRERIARILKAALEPLQQSLEKAPEAPRITSEPAKPRLQPASPIAIQPPPATKKHVFVAMPFSEEFQDIYEFGIYGPIRRCGFICERVDEPLFTGDILQRITQRISGAEFVVAELTGARPNVYLEVGYAWGKNIPVITLAREGEKLQFDVSTHRCIFYRTIGQLAKDLERLVGRLYTPES